MLRLLYTKRPETVFPSTLLIRARQPLDCLESSQKRKTDADKVMARCKLVTQHFRIINVVFFERVLGGAEKVIQGLLRDRAVRRPQIADRIFPVFSLEAKPNMSLGIRSEIRLFIIFAFHSDFLQCQLYR